jgi:hypothetical protein
MCRWSRGKGQNVQARVSQLHTGGKAPPSLTLLNEVNIPGNLDELWCIERMG